MSGPLIAVFTKNRTNPAYEAARLGADRTATRLGGKTVHYVPERPDDIAEQIALIGEAVAEKPDAAVFVPVDVTAVNNAIQQFDAANIPLFNIITRTTAGRRVTFVGSDDRALAANISRYLFAKLGGEGTIIVVEGTPASATSLDRLAGFRDALAGHPDIKVRCSIRGDYQRDTARNAFRGWDAPRSRRARRAPWRRWRREWRRRPATAGARRGTRFARCRAGSRRGSSSAP